MIGSPRLSRKKNISRQDLKYAKARLRRAVEEFHPI
jgi:hypothetical protein